MAVTLIVLAVGTVAGLVFFTGYTRWFVRLAVATVLIYLVLTVTVVGSGLAYLAADPAPLEAWWADVWAGNWVPDAPPRPANDWGDLAAACLPLFPPLALGLSGF